MASTRLYLVIALTLAAAAAVVGAASVAAIGPATAKLVDDCAQLAGAFAAVVACVVTARHRTGTARTWRLVVAVGMLGWGCGQAIWTWERFFGQNALPSPSLADVGYLTLPVFALAALVALATEVPTANALPARSTRSARLVLVLDGLIVVGSLFVLTWATSLGAVVHAGAPGSLEFTVAIAYPVTDYVLVVLVVLLATVRGVRRPALLPLGLGLVAISASDSLFAYVVSSGAEAMPIPYDLGFVAGPALIAVAAFAADEPGRRAPGAARGRHHWVHLGLPYLPVAATGGLIVWRTASGHPVDSLEVYLAWLVIALVVARQLITLVENVTLLDRVSEGQEQLAYQAFHDPLTGLANRTLFRERLTRAVERHGHDGLPVALLFVDLDDFKLINDSLGHAAGDRLLGMVGIRLRGCVRTVDAVARVGGDEFAVLLDGGIDSPERVGERILAAMHHPFVIDGHAVSVGASVGVVVPGEEPTLTPDALLRRADAAMYAGKRRGKGLLVRYRPDVADGFGNPDLPNLLAGALAVEPARAGFDVHYQPIVRLSDGTVAAVEALARWKHPVAGPVTPDVFVAVAERAGLVARLDDFVLDRACADLPMLRARFGHDLDVHVNVSASRLANPELEQAVAAALDRYDVPAQRLVLEITETSRITDLTAAAAAGRRLRDRGVRLALDDFGTGFNALAQLHALPVDVVKLDRAITSVDADPLRAEALCRSVLEICTALKITVVAEGVETDQQAEALARLGCALGQGYRYGLPEALNPPPANGTNGHPHIPVQPTPTTPTATQPS